MQDKIFLGLRIILGLIYLIFGLNGFFQFFAPPQPTPEGGQFLGALAQTGYMFPLIKATEVLAGAALLANKFTPLALVIVFPVTLNIFLYHSILDPGGFVMGLALLVLNLALAWSRKNSYRDLVRM